MLLNYASRARRAPTENTHAWNRILLLLQERSAVDFSAYKIGDRSAPSGKTDAREPDHRSRRLSAISAGEPARGRRALQRAPDRRDKLLPRPGGVRSARPGAPGHAGRRPDGAAVRVWIAGCSTGEEAYSIGIVLRETGRCGRAATAGLRAPTSTPGPSSRRGPASIPTASQRRDPGAARALLRQGRRRLSGPKGSPRAGRVRVAERAAAIRRSPSSTWSSCRNLLIYLEPSPSGGCSRSSTTPSTPAASSFSGPSETIERSPRVCSSHSTGSGRSSDEPSSGAAAGACPWSAMRRLHAR